MIPDSLFPNHVQPTEGQLVIQISETRMDIIWELVFANYDLTEYSNIKSARHLVHKDSV